MKKAAHSTQNSKNLTSAFVRDNCHTWVCIRSDLCSLLISPNGILKITSTQGLKFNKNFNTSLRAFLSVTDAFITVNARQ